jgi:uncharacterized protein HemX
MTRRPVRAARRWVCLCFLFVLAMTAALVMRLKIQRDNIQEECSEPRQERQNAERDPQVTPLEEMERWSKEMQEKVQESLRRLRQGGLEQDQERKIGEDLNELERLLEEKGRVGNNKVP